MKINIAAISPFHIFDLARCMERMGYLNRLYTAYPRWKVTNLPLHKVKTFPWVLLPTVLSTRLGLQRTRQLLNHLATITFDTWMANSLEDCDIFHCLSGFGTRSHYVAQRQFGAITMCDRGSSHICYQDEILAEEYARWGLPYQPISRHIMARELEEYATSDLIVIPSTFVYRSFIEKGISAQKLVKIPYGVNLSLFKPVAKEDQVFRVIYTGALSIRKGIPYLLEALATLRLPNFDLWLIGNVTNEIKPFLKKYEGGFRSLGHIPREELYRYYSQGSVFVIASIEEGLALVQAQAMACGLPVIATTNTGGEDLFTNGVEGFIVPIRSPEAIREKVLYLYEHPEVREEMSRAALQRVQQLGGWRDYGEQMVTMYEQALARRGKPSGATS
jgi:alpha-maltose-1-phosphate synthase